MKQALSVFAASAGLALTTAIAPAHAAGFNLDFSTAPDGTTLNAYALDSAAGQTIGSTTYSTTLGNVGEIWNSIGINITVEGSNAPLGLFNSNCLPYNDDGTPGTSVNGFTEKCNSNKGNGDSDLASGEGSYNSISYNTDPQGNVLILEESPGLRLPDDTTNGGTIKFNFDLDNILSAVRLEKIGIIDDAQGTLLVNFWDGSSITRMINNTGENQLQFFTLAPEEQMKNIKDFSVSFNDSGAITGLVFAEFQTKESVPEPMTLWGVVAVAGVGYSLKRRQAATQA